MHRFTAKTLPLFVSIILSACGGGSSNTPPTSSNTPTPTPVAASDLDLRSLEPSEGLIRLYGSTGRGDLGLPVSGGYDMNGDGNNDFAMASMLAAPQQRSFAGQVALVLGDGAINRAIDSGASSSDLITFQGSGVRETAGSEVWMGDVTGDGLGDLLIARQNFEASNPDRPGAGALSIVIGSPQLTTLAAQNDTVDLLQPPSEINMITFIGAQALDRLGIWMRVGDITGDGIDDFAVGADQTDTQGGNAGTVYVIEGGPHLNTATTVDLNNLAASPLAQHVAIVNPPANSGNYHFGATLNIADLDNNGRAELIVGATLNRSGATTRANNAPFGSAQGSGGFPSGRLFIVWDDNFPTTWTPGLNITTDSNAPGSITDIRGGTTSLFRNDFFGEEILGGLDYDGDNQADLFVGDIAGDTQRFTNTGLGFVFFNAADLRGLSFSMANPPSNLNITTILGPDNGAISSDTALHGDFDNDGIDDIAIASPHASPFGRVGAGALHVLWGQGVWPNIIELEDGRQPSSDVFNITNILGANGQQTGDTGDTLAYSADAGDIDSDGHTDIITNEMVGNGLAPEAIDVGNLIIISGATLTQLK